MFEAASSEKQIASKAEAKTSKKPDKAHTQAKAKAQEASSSASMKPSKEHATTTNIEY